MLTSTFLRQVWAEMRSLLPGFLKEGSGQETAKSQPAPFWEHGCQTALLWEKSSPSNAALLRLAVVPRFSAQRVTEAEDRQHLAGSEIWNSSALSWECETNLYCEESCQLGRLKLTVRDSFWMCELSRDENRFYSKRCDQPLLGKRGWNEKQETPSHRGKKKLFGM